MKAVTWRSLCLALCITAAAASFADAQGFYGLYSRDGSDVIAVGDNGQTYRSLNGGSSWSASTLGVVTLRDVTGRGVAYLAVGDQGSIWRSVDAGGSWTQTLAPNGPSLQAAAMVTDLIWVVAGSGGTILRTTDAGDNWTAVSSGTSAAIDALRFTDSTHGWAAGDQGTLLETLDGGASWSPVAVGTANALLSVDQRGNLIWVVGANGTAWRSIDGGASFSPVNLKLDARADVTGVVLASADSVTLVGGGGFIRHSADGGATWTFAKHPLLAPITRVAAFGDKRWVANATSRVVMRSTDRGVTWQYPSGTTTTQTWIGRYSQTGNVRGSGFALNPVYKSTIYCGIGGGVARSRNNGSSWSTVANFPSGYTVCNAFMVSPKDSNLWLAAITGGSVSDRVYRSTNAGASWTSVLTNDFGEYGIPLEMDPDRPDTVWFGGEANANGNPQTPLYRSFDFGATWHTLPGAAFRSPCDLEALPDTAGILIVADGVTGSGQGKYWRSTDYGATFTLEATRSSSEIPGLATSRLRNNTIFGTNWSSGGVQRSTNFGDTWPSVDGTSQAWAIDIARDDPNVVLFGQYLTPYNSTLSLDGGDTFSVITTPGTFSHNYGHYLRDRATIFAEQSGGIWQLQTTLAYTPGTLPAQSLSLTSPTGGESWQAGSTHDVTWTQSGVAAIRIEWRRSPSDPWELVTDVGATPNHCAWQLPHVATSQARVRVRDLWDASPRDSSDADFSITGALAVNPATPVGFALGPNRPNPFAEATMIEFTMPRAADVTLDVFDLHGHRVQSLVHGPLGPGRHEVRFALGGRTEAAGSPRLAAGVYFCRLQAGPFVATRKILAVH